MGMPQDQVTERLGSAPLLPLVRLFSNRERPHHRVIYGLYLHAHHFCRGILLPGRQQRRSRHDAANTIYILIVILAYFDYLRI